jgi:hypothetical protein
MVDPINETLVRELTGAAAGDHPARVGGVSAS